MCERVPFNKPDLRRRASEQLTSIRPPPQKPSQQRRHSVAPVSSISRRKSTGHIQFAKESNRLDEIITAGKINFDDFRSRTILEVPSMSATMREALFEESDESLTPWMKARSQKSCESNKEALLVDKVQIPGVDGSSAVPCGVTGVADEHCYSHETIRLLKRSKALSDAIRANKPVLR